MQHKNLITHPGATIGSRIQYLRESKGISRSDLAARLHISRSTLKSYELEKRSVPLHILKAVREIFHCDYAFLIDGKTDSSSTLLRQVLSLSQEERKRLLLEIIQNQ